MDILSRVPVWKTCVEETALYRKLLKRQAMAARKCKGQGQTPRPKLSKRNDISWTCKDGTVKISRNVGVRLQKELEEMRKDGFLCDIKINVDAHTINVHKIVLAVNCNYFKAMFAAGLEETAKGEIDMNGYNYDAVSLLMDYFYTGTFIVNNNLVQDVLILCDMWQLIEAKEACADFMRKQIDVANCLGMLEFGERFNCDTIYQPALEIIKLRFPAVCEQDEFLELKYERVDKIMRFDDLNLGSEGEDIVLKSVMKWFLVNLEERHKHYKLLETIRIGGCSRECRTEILGKHGDFSRYSEFNRTVNQLLEGNLTYNERKPVQHLYCIGGYLQSRTSPQCPKLQTVERFDFRSEKWEHFTPLPVLAAGIMAFNIFGRLVCFVCDTVYEYNIARGEWDKSGPIPAEASHCLDTGGAMIYCEKDYCLYVINCKDAFIIKVIEKSDGITFEEAESIPHPDSCGTTNVKHRRDHCLVICLGSLYCIGGSHVYSKTEAIPTSHIIMYDKGCNKWIQKTDMLEPRSYHQAASVGPNIYIMGGINTFRLKSTERYEPCNDCCYPMGRMEKERSHFRAIAYNKKVYVMGGKSYSNRSEHSIVSARKVLHEAERFEISCNSWRPLKNMINARCLFGAAVS